MRRFEGLLRVNGGIYQIFSETFGKGSLQCIYMNMKDAFGITRLKFAQRRKST